jgi:NADH dehydrogenase (ubiquinone) 1 beta subcomplex subunit 8
VHEDNDILGVFSPEEYRHFTPGWGAVLMGVFAASVVVLSVTVRQFYPDKKSVPRTFADGLEVELGGPTALLVSWWMLEMMKGKC